MSLSVYKKEDYLISVFIARKYLKSTLRKVPESFEISCNIGNMWNFLFSSLLNGTPLQYFSWKIPLMEEPGRQQSMGPLRVSTTERLHFHFSLLCIGEGNGNPLQCSCLENPRDGEAWWVAVYGVAQSWTRLKRLSSSSSSSRPSNNSLTLNENVWVMSESLLRSSNLIYKILALHMMNYLDIMITIKLNKLVCICSKLLILNASYLTESPSTFCPLTPI